MRICGVISHQRFFKLTSAFHLHPHRQVFLWATISTKLQTHHPPLIIVITMKQLPKNAITFDNTDEVFCVHGRCSEKTLGPLKSGIPNLVRIRTKVLKWSGIGPELGTLVWIFLDGFVMTEKTRSFCFRNFAIQFFCDGRGGKYGF